MATADVGLNCQILLDRIASCSAESCPENGSFTPCVLLKLKIAA